MTIRLTKQQKDIVEAIYKLDQQRHGTSVPEIARYLNIDQNVVSSQKTKIYKKFEITGTQGEKMYKLIEKIRALYASGETIEVTEEDTEEAREEPKKESNSQSKIESKSPKDLKWVWILLGAGFFIILLILLIPKMYNSSPEAISNLTNTIQPTERPTEGQGGVSETLPIDTSTFTLEVPTFTLVPPTSTMTFTPTFTPLPTDTLTPTETFTLVPTATPEEVVFLDHSFSNGIDPKLTVEGPWTIKDGALTSIDNTPIVITFGDAGWKNYEVDLSFRNFNTDGCNFYLGVRKIDRTMLAVKFVRPGRLGWWTFNNGKWAQVAGDEHLIPFAPLTIKVIVKDITFDWQDYSTITLPGYDAGSVEIHFPYCAAMDAIKVVQLP